MNIGDTIICSSQDNMIDTMMELAQAGIETDFVYEDKEKYKLVVTDIEKGESKMNDNKDNLEFIDVMERQIRESEEEFIYTMISPFCETITEKKLDKKELGKILRKGMQKSIPLDKVKQAREEVEDINEVVHDGQNHYYKDCVETKKEVLAILDKLIESEEKE